MQQLKEVFFQFKTLNIIVLTLVLFSCGLSDNITYLKVEYIQAKTQGSCHQKLLEVSNAESLTLGLMAV